MRRLRLCWLLATVIGCGEPLETLTYGHNPSLSADPTERFGVPSFELVGLLYEGLTRLTPEGAVEPAIAASWAVNPDATEYTFHLRKGVRFHTGEPVLASDVRRSLLELLTWIDGPARQPFDMIQGAASYRAGESIALRGLLAPDDSTVVVRLAAPFHALPIALADPRTSISHTGPDGTRSGSGPWRTATRDGPIITFRRNDDHWDELPHEPELTVRLVNAATALEAYERGEIGVTLVPFARTSETIRTHAREIRRGPTNRLTYIALNTRRGVLTDPRIRHAINHAVDVGTMLRTFMQDRGQVAPGPIPPGWEGHDFNQAPFPLAPDYAGRLLIDADYPGGGFALKLWFDRSQLLHEQVTEAVQWDLGALGIEVQANPVSSEELEAAASQGLADLLITDWIAPYAHSSAMLRPLFHSASGPEQGNRSFLSDPQLDSFIDRAERERDATVRSEVYRAANHRVLEMAPAIFLWFPEDVWLVRRQLDGWTPPIMPGSQRWTRVGLH